LGFFFPFRAQGERVSVTLIFIFSLSLFLTSHLSLTMASLAARPRAPVSAWKQRALSKAPAVLRAQQQQCRRRRTASVAARRRLAFEDFSTTSTSTSSPSPSLRLSPLSPSLSRRSLIGMPLEELEAFVERELGEPRARARHLYRWLYGGGGARVPESNNENENDETSPSLPPSWSIAPGPELQDGFSAAFLAKVAPFPELLDPGIELKGVRSAADGTRKLLFKIPTGPARGRTVDAVLIPSVDISSAPSSSSAVPAPRLTLCVSSQAGCAMGCAFCLTGAQGLSGSLSAAQIVGQLIAARQLLRKEEEEEGKKGVFSNKKEISNVVFMGQGEPLDNLDAVVDSVRVMTDARAGKGGGGGSGGSGGARRGAKNDDGGETPSTSTSTSSASTSASTTPSHQWSLSPNRVTVSTVGLVPQLRSLAARCDAQVALSLHAASEETRAGIVPATARHGTEEMRQALEELFPRRRRGRRGKQDEEDPSSPVVPGRGKRRHVLIEVTLLSGINDADDDARLLLAFLSKIEAKVNLIPWNPHPGSPFTPPSAERVEAFKRVIQEGIEEEEEEEEEEEGKVGEGRRKTTRKMVCTVRMPKGADEAMAACGQLGEVGKVPRAAARLVEAGGVARGV